MAGCFLHMSRLVYQMAYSLMIQNKDDPTWHRRGTISASLADIWRDLYFGRYVQRPSNVIIKRVFGGVASTLFSGTYSQALLWLLGVDDSNLAEMFAVELDS